MRPAAHPVAVVVRLVRSLSSEDFEDEVKACVGGGHMMELKRERWPAAVVEKVLQTAVQCPVRQRAQRSGGFAAVRKRHFFDAVDDDATAAGGHAQGVVLDFVLLTVAVEGQLLFELKRLGFPAVLGAELREVGLGPGDGRLVVDGHSDAQSDPDR